MFWILGTIAFIFVVLLVFFQIPYSKVKNSFQRDVWRYSAGISKQQYIFTEEDIASLPESLQNHFRVCGYIGTPKMSSMTAFMSAVPLKDANDKPPLIIDYILFSVADKPVRLAYIKSSLFGIPFEGYDSTQDGVGFMKGVIGKVFTLFNHAGSEMDKGQLLTYLGECFIIPSSILNRYITWEAVDDRHVKATISYKGISGSGVFAFDDNGFVQSFQTGERARTGNDGNIDYPVWSVFYGNYTETNGIYYPDSVKAVWHESDGDLIYFEANGFEIKFQY
jgi:hypothetical protein